MKADKSDPTRDEPIPAIVITRAIVSASKITGADPIEVASGKLDETRGRPAGSHPIAKARYYAGYALRSLYPNRNRTMLALYVGYPKNSAGSFFSALDQRLAAGLSWWSRQTVDKIIEEAGAVRLGLQPPPPPFKAMPLKMWPLPEPKADRPEPHGRPRTGLDRFAGRFGKPTVFHAGGDDQLTSRAREQRECRDLLAEAAANTAKLQAKLPPEPSDGD